MATIIGRNASVEISSDGVTYYTIGKATSNGLKISTKMADETNNDSGGFEESKPADSSGSVDVKGKFNSSNSGQALALTAALSKALIYARVRPQTSTGELQWTFTGYVSDASVDASTGAVQDFSCTIKSSGTITKAAQT